MPLRLEIISEHREQLAGRARVLLSAYQFGVMEKLLFGSDFPLIRPERYFREMEASGLSPETLIRIKGENAAERVMALRFACW